jgi:hypothetical protein
VRNEPKFDKRHDFIDGKIEEDIKYYQQGYNKRKDEAFKIKK